MLPNDWVKQLEQGDVYEREGLAKFDLGKAFPSYAELWGKYILPNRDPQDQMRLRAGLPVELEDLFNAHYSSFYHLVMAFRQIAALRGAKDYYHLGIDIGDPFYQLVSSIDMMERIFNGKEYQGHQFSGISQIIDKVSEPAPFSPLAADSYKDLVNSICWKRHNDDGKSRHKFREKLESIDSSAYGSSDFGNIAKLERVQTVEQFQEIVLAIKDYRNFLTHQPHPPIWIEKDSGKARIPKTTEIKKYQTLRWSSDRTNFMPEDYEEAGVVVETLAHELVASANRIWSVLLIAMDAISRSREHGTWLLFPPQQPEKKWIPNSDVTERGTLASGTFGFIGPASMDAGGTASWTPQKPNHDTLDD